MKIVTLFLLFPAKELVLYDYKRILRLDIGEGMKTMKICGWTFFLIAVIHYLIGIFSGEFTQMIWGVLCYGVSMKSIWLSGISAISLLLSIILMLISFVAPKHKD